MPGAACRAMSRASGMRMSLGASFDEVGSDAPGTVSIREGKNSSSVQYTVEMTAASCANDNKN